MDNIKKLNQPLHTSLTVDQALGHTEDASLERVIVMGLYEDGDLYSVSSRMTKEEALWLIKQAELDVLGL